MNKENYFIPTQRIRLYLQNIEWMQTIGFHANDEIMIRIREDIERELQIIEERLVM